MGNNIHASKLNLESEEENNNQKSLKSIIKNKYRNMSKKGKQNSQVKLISFKLKEDDRQPNQSRRVSKVRFEGIKETNNEKLQGIEETNNEKFEDIKETNNERRKSSADNTNDNNNQHNTGTRTHVYKSTVSHLSVTCHEDISSDTNRRSSSSTNCTFLRVTSQVTIKSHEDSASEDEVFCEYSSEYSGVSSEDDNDEQQQDTLTTKCIYKSTVSHISVTCYDKSPSSSTSEHESDEQSTSENNNYQRTVSQLSVTYLEELVSDEDTNEDKEGIKAEDKKTTYRRKVSEIRLACYEETGKAGEDKKQESSSRRKVSEIRLACYEETEKEDDDKKRKSCSKRRRKKTVIELYGSRIEVCRSKKEIAQYCLPLPTSQFIGQTTSSLHTDEVDKGGHESLHLGVYLRMMDGYLRHFETPEEFTGTEKFYLKLLRYIATKRQLPDETEEGCYDRLLGDSRRFVEIYHRRGEFSQPLKCHLNYWGSRQQLLSSKVITDWVDRENGPLDPIFGALLQPTTGRTGAGDSCWLHHFMFDGNGFVAYHTAVHDAFGYLKVCHDVGPGYDYLHHSKLKTSSPLAGQVDGMSFWRNVLKQIEFKPNVSDLTIGALALVQCHPETRNTVL